MTDSIIDTHFILSATPELNASITLDTTGLCPKLTSSFFPLENIILGFYVFFKTTMHKYTYLNLKLVLT